MERKKIRYKGGRRSEIWENIKGKEKDRGEEMRHSVMMDRGIEEILKCRGRKIG
ncbi:hypothetical protein [Paenibacillus xylanexedens]|uniref:hypothetical protein n=1 Tax=Paenibacillus xylanexedens TaxID=528191 RepID=UPI0016436385|nr:hypothetical protein [Paenibacillus xylanexedens]